MYALSLSLLLPLLAAAAPAPIADAGPSATAPGPVPTPQPSAYLPPIPPGGSHCAAGTGPQAQKDRAFFAKVDSVLSNMKMEWNTPTQDKWSFPNSKGQTVSGNVMFWVENTEKFSDPGTCINYLRPGVYRAIDAGATGGSFVGYGYKDGPTSCTLKYTVNMDDPKQNVCSSW